MLLVAWVCVRLMLVSENECYVQLYECLDFGEAWQAWQQRI